MLIGREKEFEEIKRLILTSIIERKPLVLYISGSVGTGKTATVKSVLTDIKRSKEKHRSEFINCVSMQNDIALVKEISNRLSRNNRNKVSDKSNSLRKVLENKIELLESPLLIVLDEMDALILKKPTMRIFDWPYKFNGKVLVIGIANSRDLKERFFPDYESKEGFKTVVFKPYDSTQIFKILEENLKRRENEFDSKAIELCAKKISTLTGDIRSAFSIAEQMIVSKEKERNIKTPPTTPKRGIKRPLQTDLQNTTPTKKSACIEVLSSIKKVYASPCHRSKLPLQQRIILAILMKICGTSQSQKFSISKEVLSEAYFKVCEQLNLNDPCYTELEANYNLLASQAMISFSNQGTHISYVLDRKLVRDIIVSDDPIITNIENIDI